VTGVQTCALPIFSTDIGALSDHPNLISGHFSTDIGAVFDLISGHFSTDTGALFD
jgi:hypothetical protein